MHFDEAALLMKAAVQSSDKHPFLILPLITSAKATVQETFMWAANFLEEQLNEPAI